MLLNDELRILLGKIGFFAASESNFTLSDSIFSLLARLTPDNPNPVIGLAASKLAQGKLDEADTLLTEQALASDPGNRDALLYLALVKRCKKDPDAAAEILLRIQSDADPVGRLAKAMLEQG